MANEIIKAAKENARIASTYAVEYAKSDNPQHKATFEKYTTIANTYDAIHGLVCKGLHAVEAEMQKKGGAA